RRLPEAIALAIAFQVAIVRGRERVRTAITAPVGHLAGAVELRVDTNHLIRIVPGADMLGRETEEIGRARRARDQQPRSARDDGSFHVVSPVWWALPAIVRKGAAEIERRAAPALLHRTLPR